jgi:8-oxo-dGTP pyrophosphatase MutT (NUDIX family)
LLGRARAARAEDFTRRRTPITGGRDSAVLVLLADSGNGTSSPDVLVLQRAATLRYHAGQPAFPGGAADPGDADAAATALREAWEEVGLDPTSVTVLAELPKLWIAVSDFVVTPVLAWWHAPHEVHPRDPGEVARVARLPIAELVDPSNRVRVRHPSGWVGPAFQVGGMLVWGFTAGVLAALLEMGGWATPAPPGPLVDLPPAGADPAPDAAADTPASGAPASDATSSAPPSPPASPPGPPPPSPSSPPSPPSPPGPSPPSPPAGGDSVPDAAADTRSSTPSSDDTPGGSASRDTPGAGGPIDPRGTVTPAPGAEAR